MKSDSNTEMELLLRRHARRRKSTPAAGATDASAHEGNEQTGGTHMDADEMNAYAENALPAPARARYMAHLADCDNCRAIVTNLTLAANVPVRDTEDDTQPAASHKRSWREWLAALLSPPLIRYGVPALVLISVVGIVFLAIRQRGEERRSDEPALVARNNDRSETQNTSILKPEAGQSPATLASPTLREEGITSAQPKEGETAQSAAAPADKEALAKTRQTNEQTREPENLSIVKNEPTATPANEASRQERAARDQRDEDLATAAPRQAAPPPPVSLARPAAGATAPQPTEADRIGRNRKDDSTSDDRPGAFGTTGNTASREAEERQTTTTAKSTPSTEARRRAAPKVSTMREGADANTSGGRAAGEGSSATREVGGRHFRRQGSAWVDTAYAQGRATVNVTRGSEQYRALTADEPGLRTIAEQLGGEVIVVWKGRAYRIR
jgi:hypothetical protein